MLGQAYWLSQKRKFVTYVTCSLLISSSIGWPAWAEDGQAIAAKRLTAIGTVHPLYKSTLGSVVSGRVEAVLVDVGDHVKKGQPLVILDQKFFAIAIAEAQAGLRSAILERDDAARNLERMKKLFDKPEGQAPSISQKRFEDAQTRYEQAEVAVQSAEEAVTRAQTNLAESTIAAPYDGVITKRLVHPGEPVNATPVTKMVEMLSIDDLYVEFSIPQLQMARLQVGTPLLLSVEGGSNSPFSTTISRIYPDIDEKTRAVKCRAVLKNVEETVSPGALVHIEIPLNTGDL